MHQTWARIAVVGGTFSGGGRQHVAESAAVVPASPFPSSPHEHVVAVWPLRGSTMIGGGAHAGEPSIIVDRAGRFAQ